MKTCVPVPLAECPELDGWDIYAVDGHYQKSACFDPKTRNSKGDLSSTATGHFFRLDLRTHHMSCLDMSNPQDGKKKAHDMTVIKRSSADKLRYGAEKRRKVMLVWDKACIDYHLWHRLKHSHGIYFITLENPTALRRYAPPTYWTAPSREMKAWPPTTSWEPATVSSCGELFTRILKME